MKMMLNHIKKNAANGPFTFENDVDVSELESLKNDIRKIEPVRVQGNCVIDGDQYIFSLHIEGEMILPCARTLADVPYPFEIDEVEIFSESPHYGKEEEENEIYQIKGEVIDLLPCIKENILLEIPFRVFSKDKDVLEQALTEGNGWTLTLEEDQEQSNESEKKIDPRLKKLQSLLDDEEKEE